MSTGVEVHTGVTVGKDISFEQLHKDYDCLYVAIGAHTDKKTGIPGEDSVNVMSAVEMLRDIGDDIMPDFSGKKVVVIGGGNVAMDVTRSSIRLGAEKVTCVYRRRSLRSADAGGNGSWGCRSGAYRPAAWPPHTR